MSPEEFVIWWNNTFPKDRSYRKKYNIAFGSLEHRQINQIDVYFDQLEELVYDRYIKQYKEEKEGLETYKKTGEWLKQSTFGDKEFDEIFDNLDVSKFNSKKEENG